MMLRQNSILSWMVGVAMATALLSGLAIFPRASSAYASADADRGKQLFEKRCTGCHSLDRNEEGPRLRGVYGRQAGKSPGFTYSAALQSSQLTWNDASLDKWLMDPDSLIPDNGMEFYVANQDERADIISYLKKLSTK
ncbi:c-type cytochrome [Alloacidobacterium sp.]|uniref:c-type cytochrome n=1 Tax=Alloacidobacterium sp. TaxID=2951999 RepID=UPI002D59688C|nr:c-type cytochrome [Alloacidobacterium sp.]HYK35531.1 c-type cytochrome [Alloacidobacterium sp.]